MTDRYAPQVYSRPRVWLHWLGALLVVLMIGLGTVMGDLRRGDPLKPLLLQWHLAAGIILWLFTLARLILRRVQPGPEWPRTYSRTERWLVGGVHGGMYMLMLMLPLAGLGIWWLDPYLLATPGRDFPLWRAETAAMLHRVHFLGAWALAGLVVIHVVGAVRGLFGPRTGRRVLRRMVWPRRTDGSRD